MTAIVTKTTNADVHILTISINLLATAMKILIFVIAQILAKLKKQAIQKKAFAFAIPKAIVHAMKYDRPWRNIKATF